jgi:hypothetical protein
MMSDMQQAFVCTKFWDLYHCIRFGKNSLKLYFLYNTVAYSGIVGDADIRNILLTGISFPSPFLRTCTLPICARLWVWPDFLISATTFLRADHTHVWVEGFVFLTLVFSSDSDTAWPILQSGSIFHRYCNLVECILNIKCPQVLHGLFCVSTP